jgi:hypothetical protein
MAPSMFFVAHRPKKPWIIEKEFGCLQIYWTGFPEIGNPDETTGTRDKKGDSVDLHTPPF